MIKRSCFFRNPFLLIFSFLTCLNHLSAQSPDWEATVDSYIEKFKLVAVQDMQVYGIPASIKLAQAIIESRAGLSPLASEANNHFGIKCHKEWTGKRFIYDDDLTGECFRKYEDPFDSFHDHSEFLTTRDRYRLLFTLDITDYKAWAQGLKDAGYATNPKYPEILIKTIEKYHLYRYDMPETLSRRDDTLFPVQAPAEIAHDAVYFAPGAGGRKVYLNNHVQFIRAGEKDDLMIIGRDFGIPVSSLQKFNDLNRSVPIGKGQLIYLQPKQRKGTPDFHVAAPGQTMWEISQIYGIKLNNLYKFNKLKPGSEPPPGKMLRLR
jgi:hypothetical protein